jgi:hypothetical protein
MKARRETRKTLVLNLTTEEQDRLRPMRIFTNKSHTRKAESMSRLKSLSREPHLRVIRAEQTPRRKKTEKETRAPNQEDPWPHTDSDQNDREKGCQERLRPVAQVTAREPTTRTEKLGGDGRSGPAVKIEPRREKPVRTCCV